MAETRIIPIGQIAVNTGQIPGVKKNPRLIKGDKYYRLVQSIKDDSEMLDLRELLVYEHNGKFVIIGGNMRYRACKELGYTELPCKIIPPATTPAQLNAYIIKDNAGFGEWDWDELANAWDEQDLVNWGVDFPHDDGVVLEEIDEAKEDDFNESEEEVQERCRMGDIWQCGSHRLMCGDATSMENVNNLMNGEVADLLLTDPPYNVNVGDAREASNRIKTQKQGTNFKPNIDALKHDKMPRAKFEELLFKAFSNALANTKRGGVYYIWYASASSQEFQNALEKAGSPKRYMLVWVKAEAVLNLQDYHPRFEPCLYGWREGAAHYFIKDRTQTTVIEDEKEIDLDKMKKDEMRDLLRRMLDSNIPTTVIREKKPAVSKEHPTMKPIRLFGRLIINSSRQGERVLDPFGGSGTTMMACEQLGRKCYMMELDPHYCDVILARWEKLTGQTAVKIN